TMRKKKSSEPYDRNRPSDQFLEWWNPTGTDELSGASMGGHPDARRVWAREEPGRWNRRTYGTIVRISWQAEIYLNEFYAWKEAGCPEREPFTSLAVSLPA